MVYIIIFSIIALSLFVLTFLKLIKENKLTAKEFANKVGIAGGSITDWKTGRSKPSVQALRKIAKRYKVQLEWLTGDSKYKTKEEEFEDLEQRRRKVNERFTNI